MRTLKRKTRSDKFPLSFIRQDNTARRSKAKCIISAPTGKMLFKDIWIGTP
jgi:hypothetical protein